MKSQLPAGLIQAKLPTKAERMRKQLGAKSKVEVIRRGLRLLSEQTERDQLRAAYAKASAQAREATSAGIQELDHLNDEGVD